MVLKKKSFSKKEFLRWFITRFLFHLQKAHREKGFGRGSLPATEHLFNAVLSLPIRTEIKNEEQDFIIQNIIDSIKK